MDSFQSIPRLSTLNRHVTNITLDDFNYINGPKFLPSNKSELILKLESSTLKWGNNWIQHLESSFKEAGYFPDFISFSVINSTTISERTNKVTIKLLCTVPLCDTE